MEQADLKKNTAKHAHSEKVLEEIESDFKRFVKVRKIYGIFRNVNVVLLGFSIGFVLWGLAILFMLIFSTSAYVLSDAMIKLLPYCAVSLLAMLVTAAFLALRSVSRMHINLEQYIHWCDVEQKFDSELLTAFERMYTQDKTEFDKFVEKKAIAKISEMGVPQSYTKSDLKKVYAFASMLIFCTALMLVLSWVNQKSDLESMQVGYQDQESKNSRNSANKSENADNSQTSDDTEAQNAPSNTSRETNTKDVNKPETSEEKKEEKEKKNDADNDENDEKKKSENEENKEDQNQSDDKDKNKGDNQNSENSAPKPPENNAKFELDPKKLTPEADANGETKVKKEKVYHLDKDSKKEGDLIDPAKLLPNIKNSGAKVRTLPLSTKEKELIEKYRNMLEKKLTSR